MPLRPDGRSPLRSGWQRRDRGSVHGSGERRRSGDGRDDRPAGGAQRGRRTDRCRARRRVPNARGGRCVLGGGADRRGRHVLFRSGPGRDHRSVGANRANRVDRDIAVDGPMGPTRMALSKPVIAAVEGYAVAGGLELAIWCDLRVAARDATFGVYCRRWGVPLVDGGTVRLPRLIGQSHALDLILTGRGVSGDEARSMGLANRLTEPGARPRRSGVAGPPGRCVSPGLHAERSAVDLRAVGDAHGRCARQRDPDRPGHDRARPTSPRARLASSEAKAATAADAVGRRLRSGGPPRRCRR